MLRPCLLVIDREFAGNISTRKLVLETAKFNVITAYSYEEGLATLERFPRMHGVVVTADQAHEAEVFLQAVRGRYPEVKSVLTSARHNTDVADIHVEGFSPDKLLEATRSLFPEPTAEIGSNELKLAEQIGEA